MGARVYLPTLGRFLQVDPVLGGTPNPYVYVSDPVNGDDYSGLFSLGKPDWLTWRNIGTAAAAVGAGVGVAACVVATAGICAAPAAAVGISAGVAGVGGAAAYSAKNAGTKEFDVKYLGVAAGASAAGGAAISAISLGAVNVVARVGKALYNSPTLGRQSKLFGSKALGAPKSGVLNSKNLFRVGWSTAVGNKVFRVAVGPNLPNLPSALKVVYNTVRHLDILVVK